MGRMVWRRALTLMALSIACFSHLTVAATVGCPGLAAGGATPNRTADFTDAVAGSCRYQEKNTTAADINNYYLPKDWVELDEAISTGTDPNELLNIVYTQGTNSVNGTWKINNANIWDTYGRLAFSTHIGNGSGSPDSWAWLITPGVTSGTFNITAYSAGTFNGFSNAKLYGSVVTLPAAAWLFGSALLGLVAVARRKAAV